MDDNNSTRAKARLKRRLSRRVRETTRAYLAAKNAGVTGEHLRSLAEAWMQAAEERESADLGGRHG